MERSAEENQKRNKAEWSDFIVDIFVRICVAEVLADNRPNGHFNKQGWKNISNKLEQAVNKNYNQKQLKNKWDNLKRDWQLWTNLVGKETGLGWDSVKQTVDASQDWWDKKLKENPDAVKFRTKGLRNADDLDILFKDVATTGEGSWAPSMGCIPNDGEYINEIDRMNGIEANINEIFNNVDTYQTYASFPKSTSQGNIKKRKKIGKEGSAMTLSKQLDRLCDSVDGKNDESSIPKVMDMLRAITEIERGSELFMKATKVFLKNDNREMFVALKDTDLQIEFLKQF